MAFCLTDNSWKAGTDGANLISNRRRTVRSAARLMRAVCSRNGRDRLGTWRGLYSSSASTVDRRMPKHHRDSGPQGFPPPIFAPRFHLASRGRDSSRLKTGRGSAAVSLNFSKPGINGRSKKNLVEDVMRFLDMSCRGLYRRRAGRNAAGKI